MILRDAHYDLPRPDSAYFDEQDAEEAVNFIESLEHFKGAWEGEPFLLMDWQEKIIRDVFGWKRADGKRLYRKVYFEIPKKNGKTTLTSAVTCYMLVADGEAAPEIYLAASNKDQAKLVFRPATKMIQRNRLLDKNCDILDYKNRIECPGNDGFIQVLSSDPDNTEGIDAHMVVYDELHVQAQRDLYDTLQYSINSRREPLFWMITTAGNQRQSICREQHDYARRILEGKVTDPSFYPAIFKAPETEDYSWHDENTWYIANPALEDPSEPEEIEDDDGNIVHNPNRGFLPLEGFRADYREASKKRGEQNSFKRRKLNMWVSSHLSYVDIDEWNNLAEDYTLADLQGRTCFGGLDLASKIDLVSLCLAFPEERTIEFETEIQGVDQVVEREVIVPLLWPFFWVPEARIQQRVEEDGVPYDDWLEDGHLMTTPGNRIDLEWIKDDIEHIAELVNIEEVAFDPWGADYIVNKLDEMGIQPVEMRQGTRSMNEPTTELDARVQNGTIVHPGHPILTWNMENLIVSENASGWVKPNKDKSTEKIDGAVAAIMALDRIIRTLDEPEEKGSVYSERGVRTFEV